MGMLLPVLLGVLSLAHAKLPLEDYAAAVQGLHSAASALKAGNAKGFAFEAALTATGHLRHAPRHHADLMPPKFMPPGMLPPALLLPTVNDTGPHSVDENYVVRRSLIERALGLMRQAYEL